MNSRNLLSFFAVLALAACGAEGTSEAELGEEGALGSPLQGAKKVVLGTGFACALTDGNGVLCWGDNTHGQLGDGTNKSSSLPVQVVGLEGGVKDVVAGEAHACALLSSESVLCWGNNQYGHLGAGGPGSSNVPVKVDVDASGAFGLDTVGIATCIFRPGVSICWGMNDGGTSVGSMSFTTLPPGTPTNQVCFFRNGIYTCWAM